MPDSPSVHAIGIVRNIVAGGNPEALSFDCSFTSQRIAPNEYSLHGSCALGTQTRNGVTGTMSVGGGCRHFSVQIDPSFPYDGSVCP
jgi:hypothetical protein